MSAPMGRSAERRQCGVVSAPEKALGRCECRGCYACEEGDSHAGSPPDAVRLVPVVGVRDFHTYPTAHAVPMCEPCALHHASHAERGAK